MATQPNPYFSPEEYLAMERVSEVKHEYFQGEIFALAGTSANHNQIVVNIIAALRPQMRKRGCRIYASEMRVNIPHTGLYTYPDISALCGTPRFEDDHLDTLLNPAIIVEVLSPSTEQYDRGKKFEQYRTLASLAEYLLIAQDSYHLEHYIRQENASWLLTEADSLEVDIDLPSIACRLTLAEVYEDVEIDTPAT